MNTLSPKAAPIEPVEELVCRARRGDHRAYDRIVQIYQDRAVGCAYAYLGDFHLAEDAAQEAFLLAFRDLSALREPAAFGSWLRKIVRKCCDRHARRKQLPLVALEAACEAVAPLNEQNDPAFALETAEQKAQVLCAVNALAPTDRAVITLFYLGEQHTAPKIAAFLGVSVATVKKRLERARRRLKERMLTMVENTLRENAPSQNARFVEVTNLLRRIEEMLRHDARVGAAYLAHFGKNEGWGPHDDVWSSINVHVVVRDENVDDFATSRRAFAARLGEPLLYVEGAQNAPAAGYYLMAVYDGAAGPYEVDWYWHRQSTTRLPQDTRLLFDRVSLPPAGEPTAWAYTNDVPPALEKARAARTETEVRADEGRNVVSLFWAMLLIGAKCVARDPHGTEMPFLSNLESLLESARAFCGQPDKSSAAVLSPAAKLARLRELAREMEALMPQVVAVGADVPGAAPERARRFLDQVEAAAAGG